MYSSCFFGLLGGFYECKFGRKKRRHLWAFISSLQSPLTATRCRCRLATRYLVIINLSFCGFLNNIDEVVCVIKYLRIDGQAWRCLTALLDGRLHFHASGGGILQPRKIPPLLSLSLDRAFLKMQKSFAIKSLLLLHF